jgi:hypothetical protein
MIQDMQLIFFVENAAKLGAANPGKGVGWASNQLAPREFRFATNSSAICAESACRTDHGTVASLVWVYFKRFRQSTQACSPILPSSDMPDGILVASMVSLRPHLVGFRFKCNRSTLQRESLWSTAFTALMSNRD